MATPPQSNTTTTSMRAPSCRRPRHNNPPLESPAPSQTKEEDVLRMRCERHHLDPIHKINGSKAHTHHCTTTTSSNIAKSPDNNPTPSECRHEHNQDNDDASTKTIDTTEETRHDTTITQPEKKNLPNKNKKAVSERKDNNKAKPKNK
jgi:hypothetical protein